MAVIGRRWLDIADEQGRRRLDQDDDFVRIEIQTALERNIHVVPVLVEGALMPRPAQLPEVLRLLARRNAAEVRPGPMFFQQLDSLVQRLEQTLAAPVPQRPKSTKPFVFRGQFVRGSTPRHIITNSLGMNLASIPAGRFTMGSPENEPKRYPVEGPQHEVELTRGLYPGVFPVTQDEYQQVVGSNPSFFTGDGRRPVETVSWFDAVAFCARLSEREQLSPFYEFAGEQVRIVGGNGYRLPTEAEWEYACRAGTTKRWWFGDEETRLAEFAWYKKNSVGTTHPVGDKPANAWGLHDMHGNVMDWCQDWYEQYSPAPATNPIGPKSGAGRVCRGGSWYWAPRYCRSAYRMANHPKDRNDDIGFRVART
jgi:formylglycine-generating enzyme required for sulfatase activity